MAYRFKWKPSKTAAREFAVKMEEIDDFCRKNGISASSNKDSYYFNIDGIDYRVSNHSIEASDRGAFNQFGERIRESYHPDGRSNIVCIHASKTRIMEIYNNLKAGYQLNGFGKVIG